MRAEFWASSVDSRREDWQGPVHMEGAVQGAVENPLVTVRQWTGAKTPPWDGPAQFQGFTDWEETSCPQSGAEDRETVRE